MRCSFVSLVLLLAASSAAPAQTFYGIAGGLNFLGPIPDSLHDSRGFAVQASAGRQLNSRIAIRLDALASRSASRQPVVVIPCMCVYGAPTCQCPTTGGTSTSVSVAGFAVNGLLNVDPPGPWARLYLIAGTGAYYLYQQPGATGAVRFGVSAGAGFVVPVRGRSRVFVEARYHDLASAPAQPRWLVPVTLGVIF